MRGEVRACLTVLEATPAGARGRFRFPPDLPIFAGHFPGLPIVPGVFLIEAARAVGEGAAGKPLRIAAVEEAKFTAEVGPGETIEVDLALAATAGGWSARATVSGAKGSAARIRLKLVEETDSRDAP